MRGEGEYRPVAGCGGDADKKVVSEPPRMERVRVGFFSITGTLFSVGRSPGADVGLGGDSKARQLRQYLFAHIQAAALMIVRFEKTASPVSTGINPSETVTGGFVNEFRVIDFVILPN